jgi:tetratricopeptide (TPR) repeat protein
MSWWHLPQTIAASRNASTPAVYLLLLLAVFCLGIQAPTDSADAHYQLGYTLFKQNKPKESLAEYEAAGRLRPPTAIDLEVIGSDYFLLEDYTSADKWLTQSVERDAKNPLALYLLGRTKYNEQQFDQAVHYLAECLKLDPRNVKAENNLGLAYERLGRTDEALAAYRTAITFDPDAPEPYLNLGTLLTSNRPQDAIGYLLKAVDTAPQDAAAHRQLGKAYLLSNQLEAAQSELEKAVGLDPQNGPAHFLLAEIYRKRGQMDQAAVETKRYAELTGGHSSPDDPVREARSLIESNQLPDAEQALRRYLDVHKNSAEAHYLLGYVLFRLQKARESLAEYTEAAKFRTPTARDLEVVGADYVLLNDYQDADKWFTKSSEWDPNNIQTLYYLGRAKYNENRFDEAISVFLKCLQLDPKNVKAEDNLGLSYEGLGRTDDAIAAYRAAIAWQADDKAKNSGPYINLGNILVETDRSEEAIPYLTEAVQLSPDDLRAHRALGKGYLHANHLEKAQAEFEKCIQIAPQNAPVHFMLAQVYRKRGLLDKARSETEQYAKLSGTHSVSESSQ